MTQKTIESFHAALDPDSRTICEALRGIIDRHLSEAEARIWHAHPVWFDTGNPIVGYSKLKSCVRLMFWSGQSFDAPGLTPTVTFKAAEVRYTDASQIDEGMLAACLADAARIQWDYANIVKRKGRLEPLKGL